MNEDTEKEGVVFEYVYMKPDHEQYFKSTPQIK